MLVALDLKKQTGARRGTVNCSEVTSLHGPLPSPQRPLADVALLLPQSSEWAGAQRPRIPAGTHVTRNRRPGEASVGEAGVGEVSVGEAGVGEAGVGEVGVGEVSVGEVSVGWPRVSCPGPRFQVKDSGRGDSLRHMAVI